MLRIVLVMHEPLGSAFARCVEHVLGAPQARLDVLDVAADADVDSTSEALCEQLLKTPSPGSLVLCDLYGATPFNVAKRAVTQARQRGARVCLLTGANLNMVLKALTDPDTDPETLRESVRCGVLRGIVGSNQAD